MPASIASIAFLTALFFCQPMKINAAGLPGSIQPPWLEGDEEQQAFQFETEGFYSRGKWKSPGMFPTELSAPPGARLCFPFALPVPTSASQSNPVLGTAATWECQINLGPPAALFGVTPVRSPWARSPVGPIPVPGAHSRAGGYRWLSCCLHRNPRGNWMRAPVSMRILNQSPGPSPGRHAWGYKDTVDHVTEELFLLL